MPDRRAAVRRHRRRGDQGGHREPWVRPAAEGADPAGERRRAGEEGDRARSPRSLRERARPGRGAGALPVASRRREQGDGGHQRAVSAARSGHLQSGATEIDGVPLPVEASHPSDDAMALSEMEIIEASGPIRKHPTQVTQATPEPIRPARPSGSACRYLLTRSRPCARSWRGPRRAKAPAWRRPCGTRLSRGRAPSSGPRALSRRHCPAPCARSTPSSCSTWASRCALLTATARRWMRGSKPPHWP